jgi:hypothetical protein
MITRIRFGDLWPLLSFRKDRIKPHMKVLHEFVEPIVASAIQGKKELEASGIKEKEDDTLLQNLVNSTEGTSHRVCLPVWRLGWLMREN